MYFFIHKIKIKRICIIFFAIAECVQFLCYRYILEVHIRNTY